MPRTMYDSITAADIPASAAMVAGYVNGTYRWSDADWARFPGAVKVRIATRADVNDGHVLDVEPGDATPAQAPGWVTMRRAAGADPTVYCNQSTLPQVKAAFRAAGVAEPHYWVAHYDGIAELPDGCVAKQYANPPASGGHWDLSIVADYWPGVDPAPAPDPALSTNTREDGMLIPAGENAHVVIPAAGRPLYLYVYAAYGHHVDVHQLVCVKATPSGPGAAYAPSPWPDGGVFEADRPGPVPLPAGTVGVVLRYTADHDFTAYVG
ncbi:MAG: hypothetical protein IRZ03_08425 [Acidobacterium ailaaui]|nr:hypothetical protein [Pseudacidobacterium ailaaui]